MKNSISQPLDEVIAGGDMHNCDPILYTQRHTHTHLGSEQHVNVHNEHCHNLL